MSNHQHSSTNAQEEEDRRIAQEMMPFFLFAAGPILLIVFMAFGWGPSY